jgi:hypothetical protein
MHFNHLKSDFTPRLHVPDPLFHLNYTFIIVLVCQAVTLLGQGNSILAPDDMIKLIPKKVEGFNLVDQHKGRTMKIGTLTYSMVERSFIKNKRKVTILLFDYNNAPIMYSQATGKWSNLPEVDTDTVSQRSFLLIENKGWEHYHKLNNSSQVLLGIKNRFYLIVSGEGVDLEALRTILALFPLAEFPDKYLDLSDPKHR